MANDVHTAPEASLTSLVADIIAGFQELIRQQLDLFRVELRQDARRAGEYSLSLALGLTALLVGGVLLCVMLPFLLAWAFPAMPLWVCYAIVGFAFAALGGALLYGGVQKFKSLNPLQGPTAEALKENLQWTTNPTTPR